MYQQTIKYAFWNESPTKFLDRDPPDYIPGKETRKLFDPMIPTQSSDQISKQRLQRLVMGQPWCTLKRLQACFTDLLRAECYDALCHARIFVDHANALSLNEILHAMTDTYVEKTIKDEDGGNILIKKWTGLAPSIVIDCSSQRPELRPNITPQISIRAARIFEISDKYLFGSPWTDDKVDYLRFLQANSPSDIAPFSLSALNEGMEHAIHEGKYTALLVLVGLSSHYANYTVKQGDPRGPEIPGKHFRSVARRRQSTQKELEKSKSLFVCLIRRHAESMPKSDASIMQWASQLRQFPTTREFGQWVLDFSARDKEDEMSTATLHRRVGPKRLPMFHGGVPSAAGYLRSRTEIQQRFQDMEGDRRKLRYFESNIRQMKRPYQ